MILIFQRKNAHTILNILILDAQKEMIAKAKENKSNASKKADELESMMKARFLFQDFVQTFGFFLYLL